MDAKPRQNPLAVEPGDALSELLSKIGPMQSEGQTGGTTGAGKTADPGLAGVAELLDRFLPSRQGGQNVVGQDAGAMLKEGVPVGEVFKSIADEARRETASDPATDHEAADMALTRNALIMREAKTLLKDKANTPDVLLKQLQDMDPEWAMTAPKALARELEVAKAKGNAKEAARLQTREGLRDFMARAVASMRIGMSGEKTRSRRI